MRRLPIFDGHNDTLTYLHLKAPQAAQSFLVGGSKGQLDLPRAREGGLAGGFFAVCVPPPVSSPERDPLYGLHISADGYDVQLRSAIDPTYAAAFTNIVLELAFNLDRQSAGQVRVACDYRELEQCLEEGSLAIVLHLEGAEAVCADLGNLAEYYQRGVRSIGPVWSRPNVFGHGVPFHYPHSPDTGPGLTGAGRNLIRACNALGILVDLAHLNECGFREAAGLSTQPLVASHAGAHSLCPSTRNLTDWQIDAVGESEGLIGVIFEPTNIRYRLAPNGVPDNDIPPSEIVRHIDYIAQRVGIDHVALGSDFDGALMPKALPDAAALPNLLAALQERGYDHESLEKVAFRNWLRVLKATWKEPPAPQEGD